MAAGLTDRQQLTNSLASNMTRGEHPAGDHRTIVVADQVKRLGHVGNAQIGIQPLFRSFIQHALRYVDAVNGSVANNRQQFADNARADPGVKNPDIAGQNMTRQQSFTQIAGWRYPTPSIYSS